VLAPNSPQRAAVTALDRLLRRRRLHYRSIGFWLHRWLLEQGIDNMVVDSASIEVNRRARRAKTDRLDGGKLLTMLLRYLGGERRVWSA
jgi:transposase